MLRPSAVLLAILPTLLLVLASPPARAGAPVAPAELAARLGHADAPQLLDVRTPQEYGEGHIPGAVLVPHDALAGQLDRLDRSRPVVVYCRSGRRADIAEALLRAQGFEVSQLQGSWLAWEAEGLPSEPGQPGESRPDASGSDATRQDMP